MIGIVTALAVLMAPSAVTVFRLQKARRPSKNFVATPTVTTIKR
jgi:hypothetical protein